MRLKRQTWLKISAIAIAIVILITAICSYFSDYQNAKKYYELGGDNPALFLAIAKTESGFSPTAISNKGATGLCQLMPKTAQWCAEQLGVAYDQNMLLTAEYNAKLALFYIEYLSDKFSDENAVICAYNAGEGNVSAWLNNPEIYDGEFKNIPFEETKNYLQKVQKNQRKFQIYIAIFGW